MLYLKSNNTLYDHWKLVFFREGRLPHHNVFFALNFIFKATKRKGRVQVSTHKAKSTKSVDWSSGSVLVTVLLEENFFIW